MITTSKQTDKFLIVIALAKLRSRGDFVNKVGGPSFFLAFGLSLAILFCHILCHYKYKMVNGGTGGAGHIRCSALNHSTAFNVFIPIHSLIFHFFDVERGIYLYRRGPS